ncbi:MAG: sugar transferase [Clostridia bacterium]|nr:sugar transferase [Clostridia bacterium]
MVGNAVKRTVDVLAAIIGLLVLSPVFLIVSLLVTADLGRPVLFAQLRPGKDGKLFRMYKFRTMRNTTAPDGRLLPDSQRLTQVGRMLRSTSLDELPELLNVLTGQMSLVGPRPLLPQYLDRYTPEQARRHEVKPGITGWAQVNGRNALTWEEKFRLDVWYVDNWSLLLDLKILLMTVGKVLRHDGISSNGHATMPEFTGTDTDPAEH